MKILKLKEKLHIIVHQRDETMKEKDITQAAYVANQSKSYNKAKQSCELNHNHEAISIQAQIEGV
jgi:hypothetical protein